MEEQREIDGRRMVAIVEQAFCHIHCGNFGRLVLQAVEHKFVLANAVDRQFVHVLEHCLDVVGIECSQRAHHLDVVGTKGEDIGIGAKQHCEIAQECAHMVASYVVFAFLQAVDERECAIGVLHHLWFGQEVDQVGTHAHRTAAGTAASVRCRESLVQIDVHHIEAHIAGTAYAEHRVEVGSIVIHQTATFVHQFGYFGYFFLKQAEGVGVGHHHSGNVVAEQWLERLYVHKAVLGALHLHYLEAAHCSRSGVGAVSRVGHYHFHATVVAAALMIAAYHHQTGELAMSAGARIERKFAQTGEFAKRFLQIVVHLEGALASAVGLQWV